MVSVFLAGSIEMEKSKFWQKKVNNALQNILITVFNPHRDEFDKNLRQQINNPEFVQQIN